jgi:hypothetical protein
MCSLLEEEEPLRRSMPLGVEDAYRLDAVTTFPLVSTYTNGALLKPWI